MSIALAAALVGCAGESAQLAGSDATASVDGGGDSEDSSGDASSLPIPDALDANVDDSATPDALPPSAPKEVACGYQHVCVVTIEGELRCWGENVAGEVGDGTVGIPRLAPSPPVLAATEQVSLGGGQTCAVSGGKVWCWGSTKNGLLGDGVLPAPATASTPTAITSLSGIFQAGAGNGGGGHACAIMSDRSLQCWGDDLVDQLGYPAPSTCGAATDSRPCSASPGHVPGVADVAEIAFGAEHTCVRTQTSKDVFCWGNNQFGALGDGTTVTRWEAKKVDSLPMIVRLFAGLQETCALGEDGTLYCWGYERPESYAVFAKTKPIAVTGFAGPIADVHVGGGQRCALLKDGRVQCWGLGPSVPGGASNKPVTVAGLEKVTSLCSSSLRACAVESTGRVKCWGQPFLGNGTMDTSATPVEVLW